MPEPLSSDVKPSPTPGQYLLGCFIVAQLAFLALSNFGSIALYFSSSGPASAVWKATSFLSEPWAHVTGQEQYWRMFAPAVPSRSMFVRLDVDGSEIPSAFEPRSREPILHLPGVGERIWHVEKSLAAPFFAYDPIEIEKRPDEWRDFLKGAIIPNRHRYLAFMNWKKRHIDPERIDLFVSIHTPSSHDKLSRPLCQVQGLRWRPNANTLELCTDAPNGVAFWSLDR